jgi:hypothetical protein
MAKRSTLRVLVTLHFLKMTVDELITWAFAVIAKINGNHDVGTPIVPLGTMTTQVTTLQTTHQARVTDKSKAITDQEAIDLNEVLNSFTYTAEQVETLANIKGNGNVGIAKQMIDFIGFVPKANGVRPGRFFEVFKVASPGMAFIRCPRVPGRKTAVYLFRLTKTPMDANSWSEPVQTTVSSATLTQLDSDTRYYFQYAAAIVGKGAVIDVTNPQIDWSDAVSALIP